jgi:hypothetical protein
MVCTIKVSLLWNKDKVYLLRTVAEDPWRWTLKHEIYWIE